jgi:hypothetical protein
VNQHRASQRRIPTRVSRAWRAQLTEVPRASPVSGMAALMVVPILEASVSAGAAVTVGPTAVPMAGPTAVPIAAQMAEPIAAQMVEPIAVLMVEPTAVPIAALMVEPTAVQMVARTVGLDDA